MFTASFYKELDVDFFLTVHFWAKGCHLPIKETTFLEIYDSEIEKSPLQPFFSKNFHNIS